MTDIGENKLRSLDILENPDCETVVQEYLAKQKPVLIKGAANNWPALKKWPSKDFEQRYGDTEVTICKQSNKKITKNCLLSEYLAYIASDEVEDDPYYLIDWSFSRFFPELADDYTVPDYFENWLRRIPHDILVREGEYDYLLRWMYIGAKNTGSAMHQDIAATSAWNAVVTGKKQWLFYPEHETENLYYGKADGFNVDHEAYPDFSQATGYTCIQEPGDLVFTPSLWWHQVKNVEPGISVTENFINQHNINIVTEALSSSEFGDGDLVQAIQAFIPEFVQSTK